MPRLAVERPITLLMALVMVVLLGLVAYPRIPVDLLPDVTFPSAAVVAQLPGAAPQEIEALLSRPLEEALSTLPRVARITSVSAEDRASVVAEFNWGTNMDQALVDMRERIDLVRPHLPREAGNPLVVKFDPALLPIMVVSVAGPDARATADAVERSVRKRLERIEGVAAVAAIGQFEEEVVAHVDPRRMRDAGLTWQGLLASLRGADLNLPGGRIVEGGREYLVRSKGALLTSETVAGLALGSGGASAAALSAAGDTRQTDPDRLEVDLTDAFARLVPALARLGGERATVRLDQIARVVRQPAEPRGLARLNGRPSVNLLVHKASQSNTLAVARRVEAELRAIERESGGAIHTAVTMNQAEFISRAVREVRNNAVQGALLAVLILFAFLRSARAVLVIAVAVPVSMVATLLLVYLRGLSLNLMTLSGLAVGAGMLVDNSIVVLESIYQRWEEGEPPARAAVRGAMAVAGAVSGSTATTLVVFFPVVFLGGVSGLLFREFALTLGFSLLASLAVSLTFVPSAAASLLTRQPRGRRAAVRRPMGELYERLLRAALRRPGLTVLGTALLAGAAALPALRLGREFLPPMDIGQLRIGVTLPAGSTLAETEAALGEIERVVLAMPDVESAATTIGSAGAFADPFGGEVNRGQITLRLRRPRPRPAEAVADDLRRRLAGATPALVTVEPNQGFFGDGLGLPLEVVVRGDDQALLERLARRVAAEVGLIRGVREAAVPLREGRPEVAVEYHMPSLAARGLHPAVIGAGLRAAIQGERVGSVLVEGRQLPLRVRIDRAQLDGIAALGHLQVSDAFGGESSLRELADIRRETGPVVIERRSGQRVVAVQVRARGRDLGSLADEVRQRLASLPLPPGYQIEYGGQAHELRQATANLRLALGLAVALVFMVMAAQFESLLRPLVIMSTVPLGAAGAVLALASAGLPLSVPALIGLVVLAGVAVNNGIVLVDRCLAQRGGLPLEQAVAAASRSRLRPILMTSVTTLLGLMPIMVAAGEGAELSRPLAVALFGGLLFSTALTLIAVPAAFLLVERASSSRTSKRLGKA